MSTNETTGEWGEEYIARSNQDIADLKRYEQMVKELRAVYHPTDGPIYLLRRDEVEDIVERNAPR